MAAWWNKKTAIGIAVAVAIAVLILIFGPSSWRVISRDSDPPVVAAGQGDPHDGGNPAHITSRKQADAMASTSAFITKRPGDALNRYLGVVQSDALYRRIGRLVVDERAKCYSENGLTPPAEDSMEVPRSRTASLKGNDTAAFRRTHGFGVVAEYLESLETTRKASATTAKLPDLATAQAAKAEDVAAKCAARTARVINDNLAPAQMHARTRALMKEYGDSKAYRDLSESWRACMASAGYRTRYGPYESRAMAEDFLQKHLQDALMRSFERRGLSEAEQEALIESTHESFQEIPEYVRTELRTLEMKIYAADARCLSSSGAGDWMSGAENAIMQTLRQEFPSFSGVNAGSEPPPTTREAQ
jgi:uncharacterized protein YdbL (DUF1318 family)